MLYDLLYYKSHTYGAKTGRYWGGLGASGPVSWCLLLNAYALSFVLERLLQFDWVLADYPVVCFAISACIYGGTGWWYNRNSWRILDRYKDNKRANSLPSVLVVIAYYSLSFGLLLLSGIYRNHDWIFK